MNKKLVAVAVAGVLAAPLAAQAQTANVTLYGRLNLTMEAVKGECGRSQLARHGVRGRTAPSIASTRTRRVSACAAREALGGGLSAIFQIESSIQGDSSGGTLAGRETFVGLQGAWGTFKMGYFLAPYDDIHPIFGNVPTLTTSILSTANLWAQGSQNARQRRLRQPARQLDPLRLAENGRLHVLRAIGRGRRVAGRQRQHGRHRRASQAPRVQRVVGRLLQQRPVPGWHRVRSATTRSAVRRSTTRRCRSRPTGTSASSSSAACGSAWTTTPRRAA